MTTPEMGDNRPICSGTEDERIVWSSSGAPPRFLLSSHTHSSAPSIKRLCNVSLSPSVLFLFCFPFFFKSLTMFIAVIPKHSSASCIHSDSKPPPFLVCSLSLSLSAHCIPIPPLLSLQSNQLSLLLSLLLPTPLFSFSLLLLIFQRQTLGSIREITSFWDKSSNKYRKPSQM